MNILIISFGILLLIAGYSIGINRSLEVITFLKSKKVREQKKVVEMIGSSQVLLGAALITLGCIGFPYFSLAFGLTCIVILTLSMYIMNRFID